MRGRHRGDRVRVVHPGSAISRGAGICGCAGRYTSDIPLLDRWGTPLLFGPGSIHVAHTPDEYIDLTELRSSVDAYERLIRTLLAA